MSVGDNSLSVEEALNKPIEEMTTTESDTAESATTKPTASSSSVSSRNNGNGIDHESLSSQEEEEEDGGSGDWPVDEEGAESSTKGLREELAKMKEERDSFEGQYRGLLAKLSQMRSTLGDRLRQDAEELDRREQQIESLQVKWEEQQEAVETMKNELLSSHNDVERLTQELDSVRALQVQSSSSSQSERKSSEVKLRELQEITERYRIDAESWESSCMEERAYRDEIELELAEVKRERDEAVMKEAEQKNRAEKEAQIALGLQQVLEEFQSSQDSEIQRVLGDYQEKYKRVAASLEEHKERTGKAEREANDFRQGWEKCQLLEREVKEKNLLIGKLRHEGKSGGSRQGSRR
jgi:chromosome segregation ATPase